MRGQEKDEAEASVVTIACLFERSQQSGSGRRFIPGRGRILRRHWLLPRRETREGAIGGWGWYMSADMHFRPCRCHSSNTMLQR
jgi:hypothetical protein